MHPLIPSNNQIPPTQPVNNPMTPIPPFRSGRVLTTEEFENLKRQVQLLRIAQVRYIVQKYDLPANGNKTRLVQTVLHLFDVLRNTDYLSKINDDVLSLISSFHEPFTNPLDKTHKLTLQKPESLQNTDFFLPLHPFIQYPVLPGNENPPSCVPPLLGPIYVLPGNSSGRFSFSIEHLLAKQNEAKEEENKDGNSQDKEDKKNSAQKNNFRICIDFAWPENQVTPFEMSAYINGSSLMIFGDDPSPLPVDITFYCKSSQPDIPISPNVLIDFKLIKTQVPLAISVKQYELLSIKTVASNSLGIDEESLNVPDCLKKQLPMNVPIEKWIGEFIEQFDPQKSTLNFGKI